MMNFLANPARFMRIANAVLPWCWAVTVIAGGIGLVLALFVSPPDYQQGDSVRIMYIHVPAAWMAMFAYTVIAAMSAVALVWKHPLAHVIAPRGRAARRGLHPDLPGDRLALGQDQLGHVVGVGRAAHLRCWCCSSSISA